MVYKRFTGKLRVLRGKGAVINDYKKIAKDLRLPNKKRVRAMNILTNNIEFIKENHKSLYKKILFYQHNPNYAPRWSKLGKTKPFLYDSSKSFKEHINEYFGLSYEAYRNIIKNGCSVCHIKKNIHLHHIKPLAYGGDNKINNLTPLCNKHHLEVHHKKQWLEIRNNTKKD